MAGNQSRFAVLDGWRGISILAVLACHLLPLGPARWGLNAAAGIFGMAIFFTLSGFLITTFLLKRGDVRDFLIRRICRILPLAWVALAVGLMLARAPDDDWLSNFLFYANLPPYHLPVVTGHFWSLCVEMQFYVAVALLFGLFGRRGLTIGIPVGAIIVTALRVHAGAHSRIATYYRADEILSGGLLALAYAGVFSGRDVIGKLNPWLMLALYCLSTLNDPLAYARPYIAASLVGCTLIRGKKAFAGVLETRILAYVAEISYALYIVHPLLAATWLGTGDKLVKYLKRPLLLAATVAVAHLSTFYYERRWIEWGKRLSDRAHGAEVSA
jgi:peptidoglycan/LPS O-acetylase OafA/YrhL